MVTITMPEWAAVVLAALLTCNAVLSAINVWLKLRN